MTTTPQTIRGREMTAIDVHVHLEAPADGTAADLAARKYFGESGAARDAQGLAEYYRSRRMAFVVFSVDERLSGRPQLSNEEVADFAAANADVQRRRHGAQGDAGAGDQRLQQHVPRAHLQSAAAGGRVQPGLKQGPAGIHPAAHSRLGQGPLGGQRDEGGCGIVAVTGLERGLEGAEIVGAHHRLGEDDPEG